MTIGNTRSNHLEKATELAALPYTVVVEAEDMEARFGMSRDIPNWLAVWHKVEASTKPLQSWQNRA